MIFCGEWRVCGVRMGVVGCWWLVLGWGCGLGAAYPVARLSRKGAIDVSSVF